ncbi:MAG TPA: C45 family peptidase [Anaerolineales bacterium]|nr:C45 family peptidase [Anaerolineales bacterium]
MKEYLGRIHHFKGTPYEIGLGIGRTLSNRLERTFTHYVNTMAASSDMEKLQAGALSWLRRLPRRFQDEFEGMAQGANVPLERLVEWAYIEECEKKECSGAICVFNDHAWVARNNDTFVPELWGYVMIREVDERIPTINFTMEGDVFTPTGINREKLWLHYNFLPVWDQPTLHKPHVPAYVFLTEALELCRTIRDVEMLLNETDRDGGMLLFAADGKTDEFALFDCMCSKHFRRNPSDGWLVGTNHYCTCEDLSLADDEGSRSTLNRFHRMETLIQGLCASSTPPNLPSDLIQILADDKIERRVNKLITVYSNVACPSLGAIWYTFGGYPAASHGNWQKLEWPWMG